jgi:hypothetical protein
MQMGEDVFNSLDSRVNGFKARGNETITLLPAPLFRGPEYYFQFGRGSIINCRPVFQTKRLFSGRRRHHNYHNHHHHLLFLSTIYVF